MRPPKPRRIAAAVTAALLAVAAVAAARSRDESQARNVVDTVPDAAGSLTVTVDVEFYGRYFDHPPSTHRDRLAGYDGEEAFRVTARALPQLRAAVNLFRGIQACAYRRTHRGSRTRRVDPWQRHTR